MCSGEDGPCLCDFWVFCGDKNACGSKFGECWLKKQKNSLEPDRRDSGPQVMWTSGLVFGRGQGIIGLETEYGMLHKVVEVFGIQKEIISNGPHTALRLGLPFIPSYLGQMGIVEDMIHGVNYASARMSSPAAGSFHHRCPKVTVVSGAPSTPPTSFFSWLRHC